MGINDLKKLNTNKHNFSKRFYDYGTILIAIVVFVFLQFPAIEWLQFPFILLGTWFHEMGHGVTALLIGGDFKHLEIFSNGGGVAYFNVDYSFLPLGLAKAVVAAGGLLGPAITGAIFIAAAKKYKNAKITLRILIAIMIISLIFWIRSFWGGVTIMGFIVVLLSVTFLKNNRFEVLVMLFLGLQSVFSTYLQLGYLFTKQFENNGYIQISDTQSIAENTFGFYWMWAILITSMSAYLIFKSFRYYWSLK